MKQQRLKVNQQRKEMVNVELDMKCSCSPSTNDASIQFARRYLQCQSTMPVRSIRLFIETVLPHSRTIKVSIFDSNDRLLKDSDRLCSLKRTCPLFKHIPIRFTLLNTITSLGNCSCLFPSIEDHSSSLPTIIERETIDQILSTCSFTEQITILPSSSRNPSYTSIGTVDVLTPPSLQLDEATMSRITAEFGEICPSLPTLKRYASVQECSLDVPLDLSMKKHSFSSQTTWIET